MPIKNLPMYISKSSGNGGLINKLTILCFISFLNLNCYGDQEVDDGSWECGFDEEMNQRSAIWEHATLWPNARVAYEFDTSFDDKARSVFALAVEDFRNHTCIRWEQRNPGEEAYVNVYINFNTSFGGVATVCFTGKRQHLYVRYDHVSRTTLLHEMLHTMCFGHEHQRHDRDQFISYADCNHPAKIPRIVPNQAIRPDLYDYLSLSHYPCNGGCDGTAIMVGAYKNCRNKKGLSVLDSDKLNDIYNCQGCHRHRWYNIDTLTDEQSRHIVEFSPLGSDTEPIHICRGYYATTGEINPGRYRPETKTCEICDFGQLYNVTKYSQVLTIPSGPYVISESSENYKMYDSRDSDISDLFDKNMLIPVGRSTGNSIWHLTLFTNSSARTNQTFVGSVGISYASSCYNDYTVSSKIFQVFGCSML